MFLLQNEIFGTGIFQLLNLVILVVVVILFFITWRSMPKSKDCNVDINRLMKKVHIFSLHALRSNVHNENIQDYDRLNFFHEYIKGGGNGNLRAYVVKNLIMPNIKIWEGIIADPAKTDPEDIMDMEYYKETLKEIKKSTR